MGLRPIGNDSTYSTVELVHSAILRDAAEIANAEVADRFSAPAKRQPGTTRFNPVNRGKFRGMVFRPDPIRSRSGGLALSIEEAVSITLTDAERKELAEMGRRAIRKAIQRNKRAFVGLIVGHARKGENYFDRFKQGNIDG